MKNVVERKGKDGVTYYIVRVSAGYDEGGRQIKKAFSYRPEKKMTAKQLEKEIERQAVVFRDRLLEEKENNIVKIDTDIKFKDYAAKFMEVSELAPKTKDRYENLLIRINKHIGNIRVIELKPSHLESMYKALGEEKSKATGKCLSAKTVRHHHGLVSAILGKAVKEQIIPRNIALSEFTNVPRVSHKEVEHLDDLQAQRVVKILALEEDVRIKTVITLLLYTGCRRGELCGLEWQDINFDREVIHIRRATQYLASTGTYTKDTKNSTSCRVVKLPTNVFLVLRRYKEWQDEYKALNSDMWLHRLNISVLIDSKMTIQHFENDRLFTAPDGGLISPDTINFWLQKFQDKYNLPRFTPHSLRHTNITLQISAGVPLTTISRRAGHAQVSTTTNIYSHAVQTAEEVASMALDRLLTPYAK